MSELNDMSCAEFADVAAELALGVLTGRERAEALTHIDRCHACREHVRQLTLTGEELLGLLPAREPPPGFETRVMERLGLTGPAPRPARRGWRIRERHPERGGLTRRMLAAAAVVVALVASGVGGWGLRAATAPSATSTLSSAALLSASHQNVGEVFVYNGDPRWMYMSVDMGVSNGTVTCQLESADGHLRTIGSFKLTDGYGSWGSPAWSSGGAPVGARLVAANGTVLATASFPGASALFAGKWVP